MGFDASDDRAEVETGAAGADAEDGSEGVGAEVCGDVGVDDAGAEGCVGLELVGSGTGAAELVVEDGADVPVSTDAVLDEGAGAVEVVGDDVAGAGEVLVVVAVVELVEVGAGAAVGVDEAIGVDDVGDELVGVLEEAAAEVEAVDENGLVDASLVGALVVVLGGAVEVVDEGVDEEEVGAAAEF